LKYALYILVFNDNKTSDSTSYGGDRPLSKDQAIGAAIFILCVLIAIIYVLTLFFPGWLGVIGLDVAAGDLQFWAVALPVFIAFIAVMGIGAWIGWTMATTPPPKPIEEITSEIENETKDESKTLEKTEE